MERRPPAFASSIRWQSVNVISQVLLQLLFITALARMITKEDFGVMSIALVVVGFVEIFAQIGIGPALIQREQIEGKNIRAAFHFSVGLGLLFFALLTWSAPWIGAWFNSQDLAEVLKWIALSFILSSIALVPRSLLIRHMMFQHLFGAALFSMVLGNLVIGLGMAYAGYGVWAYVGALLSQNALLGAVYWWMKPSGTEQIWGRWQWTDLHHMLAYGGRSTLFNLFNYLSTKVDTLAVGNHTQSHPSSTGGWSTTGVYDRSAHLMSLPITVLGKLGDSVLFSGMAALQKDVRALHAVIDRGVGLIAWLVFPGALALAWFATEAAVLILGPSYAEAGPVVQILFIGVAFRSLVKLADAVVRAVDRLTPAIFIKSGYLAALAVSCTVVLESGQGITGVAWCVTGCTVVQFAVYFWWMGAAIQWPFRRLLIAISPGVQGLILAVPGYWAISVACPEWLGENLEVNGGWLGLRLGLVLVWSIVAWGTIAIRHPRIIDGNDTELRARWTAYFPVWIQKWINH